MSSFQHSYSQYLTFCVLSTRGEFPTRSTGHMPKRSINFDWLWIVLIRTQRHISWGGGGGGVMFYKHYPVKPWYCGLLLYMVEKYIQHSINIPRMISDSLVRSKLDQTCWYGWSLNIEQHRILYVVKCK